MSAPGAFKAMLGGSDIVLLTFDTLRYDVAQQCWQAGLLPHLSPMLGAQGWQKRHTPASFTYAAHHAFFSGFLPTPADPHVSQNRLFASRFGGSRTCDAHTFVFDEATLPQALQARGYHTLCIGGTGFFNSATAMGQVLPGMFMESHWSPALGVTQKRAPQRQVSLALRRLQEVRQPMFLFINLSAMHPPHHFYLPGCTRDSIQSQAAALQYTDAALAPLWPALRARGGAYCILCSDHGHAFGEDGWHGHRLGHASVWDVPYAEFALVPEAA
ncbi:STM4013/SEN3800 family hydrolase [Massilia sp. W12]|uniref:STM4013/SEN3800 family hydrolase n=1 Tax=Massilia sp. W12 TaxID=3126507 RepID=UPI0030CF6AF7